MREYGQTPQPGSYDDQSCKYTDSKQSSRNARNSLNKKLNVQSVVDSSTTGAKTGYIKVKHDPILRKDDSKAGIKERNLKKAMIRNNRSQETSPHQTIASALKKRKVGEVNLIYTPHQIIE